jgi:hypothetical protein
MQGYNNGYLKLFSSSYQYGRRGEMPVMNVYHIRPVCLDCRSEFRQREYVEGAEQEFKKNMRLFSAIVETQLPGFGSTGKKIAFILKYLVFSATLTIESMDK